MLPPILLRATDRLLEAVMQVACAVGTFGTDRASPPNPAYHACILLQHLSMLVIRLIRLSNNPLPTPRQPGAATPAVKDVQSSDAQSDNAQSGGAAGRGPGLCLPRRPGWLLAILPNEAPALAAALQAALADPALAPLLDAAPTLARDLRPILRALGLDPLIAPDRPSPDTPPPTRPTRAPSPPHPPGSLHPIEAPARSKPPCRTNPRPPAPPHVHFITI